MNVAPFLNNNLTLDSSSHNIVFIDSQVDNSGQLAGLVDPKKTIYMLDTVTDGLEQISEILEKYNNNVESIHLISHGEAGLLDIGKTPLTQETINHYQDQITNWRGALTSEADILLYGCNVAQNEIGQSLIAQLGDLSGADIAASTDLTGNRNQGGDWDLEYHLGDIESASLLDPGVEGNYEGILSSGHNLTEHNQLLNFASQFTATHIATKNGLWSDSSTWENGKIPTNGANVVIPDGLKVTYNTSSNSRLNTLRVDGTIQFAHDKNTKMLVDTFLVMPTGHLYMGTKDNPIQADKTTEIIFTNDKDINTNLDPMQLGKGLVSHGEAKIYGADKLDFVAIKGNALKGSQEIILDLNTAPTGWRVGDQLVLTGTDTNKKGSDADNSRFQDEVLTITAIEGNRIRFTNNDITSGDNTVLRFNHQKPKGFENEVDIYIANTSRNIIFQTENGKSVPIERRGHVMFMHNPNVEVNNASFLDLGRTDKSKLIDDPMKNLNGSTGSGTNPRGRYALHFHRTGAANWDGTAALVNGNVVIGSPGWGLVHHDSHANLENNVVFDVAGAAIVAEAGNEIGVWRNNLTIKSTGASDDRIGQGSDRGENFDFGFFGNGYWVQGAAQITMQGNIATSGAKESIVIYGGGDGGVTGGRARDAQHIAVANLLPEYQSIAKGTKNESVIDVSAVPLRELSDFESYNSFSGVSFWTSMQLDNEAQLKFKVDGIDDDSLPAHRFFHRVEDVTLWNMNSRGITFTYAEQVEIDGGLILGQGNGTAVTGNSQQFYLNLKNLHIEGFKEGIEVPFTPKDFISSRVENSYLANIQQMFVPEGKEQAFADYFEIVNSTFKSPSNNIAPKADFNVKVAGGYGIYFDGSNSSDPDSSLSGSNKIVSYGWDFDNDGKIDDFGRQVGHYFSKAGAHKVSLTVWDDDGASHTLTQTINVTASKYDNLLLNSDFSSSEAFTIPKTNRVGEDLFSSVMADEGWVSWGWSPNSNLGAAVLVNKDQGLGQVIQDNYMRRGQQTLNLDLKNTEKDANANNIVVSVWGVNGEFTNIDWQKSGPQAVGAIPMERSLLLNKTVGGSSFDWNNFQWDVDFGMGYQFVVVQLSPQGVDPNKGDYVAIDNVKLFSDQVSGDTSGGSTDDSPTSDEGTDDSPASPLKSHKLEAESILDTTVYRTESISDASGGEVLSFRGGANGEVGSASFQFSGASGLYDVVIGTFDEDDGQAQFELAKNGQLIGTITLDQLLGSNSANAQTFVSRTLATSLNLSSGDTLTITGFEDGGEHARLDFLELVPLLDTDNNSTDDSESPTEDKNLTFTSYKLEAESIVDTIVYRTESISDASGGEVLSFRGGANGEVGSASFQFSGASGLYDVVIGTFDEDDGQAQFELAKNGQLIGTITLDQLLGSNSANAQTFVSRTLATSLNLSSGDTLTITGFEDGGEHARLDFLELVPQILPS